MKLTGYHCTSLQNANDILKNDFKYSSAKNWLGTGVYFWGDAFPFTSGLDCALWWSDIKKFDKWCIFEAEIESEKVFDCVNNEKHRRAFIEMKKRLLAKDKDKELSDQEYIDGIFSMLKRKFDVLIFFTKGDAMENIVAADRLVINLQVQICVSDTLCIRARKVIKDWSNK